jgi:anti-sigma B factor antagonist
MTFNYKTEKKGGISVYSLKGELIDRDQASLMMSEIEDAIEAKDNKILLNLKDLRYINSSGLNILINILTKARKSGGEVAICCVNKKVEELLLITKLNSVFNVCEDDLEGLELLSKKN